MLDILRRSATSVFAWLILGALALAFGLSFGLPSDSITFGAEKYVKVYGEGVGDEDFRYQLSLAGRYGRVPRDVATQEAYGAREEALEGVVERLLLAHTAEELGLGATEREAEDLILEGHVILFGFTLEFLGETDEFDYSLFKNNWLRPLGIAEQKYLEFQRQEFLARTIRDVIRSSVAVPEADLRKQYDERANQISLRYASYSADAFGQQYDPTDAEIDSYVQSNRDALMTDFAAQGSRFSKLGKQMRAYVIEVPKATAAAADPDEDDGGSDDGAQDDANDADDADDDAARTALAAARVAITGGEDFRAVARRLSVHPSGPRGGDLGWVGENLGTGLDVVVDEAARAAEVDAVSEVLVGESSYFLVRVTGRREGDVAEDSALKELAAETLRRQRGSALAKEAAEADSAAVLEDGKALTEVFASPDALDSELATALGKPLEDVPIEGEDSDAAPTRSKVALRETGLTPKGQPLEGLGGPAPELLKKAWADESEAELLPGVFAIGDDYVVAGVAEKVTGTDEEYAEQRAALYQRATRQKGESVTARFAERLCLEAKAAGDVVVSDAKVKRLMTYDTTADEKAEPEPLEKKPYSVCQRVGNRGGVLTAPWKISEWR